MANWASYCPHRLPTTFPLSWHYCTGSKYVGWLPPRQLLESSQNPYVLTSTLQTCIADINLQFVRNVPFSWNDCWLKMRCNTDWRQHCTVTLKIDEFPLVPWPTFQVQRPVNQYMTFGPYPYVPAGQVQNNNRCLMLCKCTLPFLHSSHLASLKPQFTHAVLLRFCFFLFDFTPFNWLSTVN